jgi:hypothetical protein
MKTKLVLLMIVASAAPCRAHMMGSTGRPASSSAQSSQAQAWNDLDPQPGQPPKKKAAKPGVPSKLDKERAAEAERLKAQRATCDAAPPAEQQACYDKMKSDHEKWHAAHDPEDEGFNHLKPGGLKEQVEARKKCNAIPNLNDRMDCLKSLSKPQKFSDSPAQK